MPSSNPSSAGAGAVKRGLLSTRRPRCPAYQSLSQCVPFLASAKKSSAGTATLGLSYAESYQVWYNLCARGTIGNAAFEAGEAATAVFDDTLSDERDTLSDERDDATLHEDLERMAAADPAGFQALLNTVSSEQIELSALVNEDSSEAIGLSQEV